MPEPRWRGSTALKEGKVHYSEDATKSTITTSYSGPYALCLSARPAIGATITGLPSSHKVTARKVTELDAGAGLLEITVEATLSDSGFGTDPLGEPVYEIEWVELSKPIERHAKCGTLNPDRRYWNDGAPVPTAVPPALQIGKQLTWDDWEKLADQEAPSAGDGEYIATSATGAPAWSIEEYKQLKESGQDSYLVYQPVVRRTTIHLAKPPAVGAYSGKRQTPPIEAGFSRVSDFQWLGGPDRCTKTAGKFTRQTEWSGAELWALLTYPN